MVSWLGGRLNGELIANYLRSKNSSLEGVNVLYEAQKRKGENLAE